MPATILAVINQKGGVGKTTTSVNLAQSLTSKKSKVLLIDMDSQGNASQHLGIRDEVAGDNLLKAILEPSISNLSSLIYETDFGIDLIPCSDSFAAAEHALMKDSVPQTLLAEFITVLRKLNNEEWSYIIIDCPPALSLLSINALVSCQYAIIPVESSMFSLEGLSKTISTIDRIKQKFNPSLQCGVLGCRIDTRTNVSKTMLKKISDTFPELLFDAIISDSVKVKEAPSFGMPVGSYDPKCKAVTEFKTLATEVKRRLANA